MSIFPSGSLRIPLKLFKERSLVNSIALLATRLFKMAMKSLESDLTVCFPDFFIILMHVSKLSSIVLLTYWNLQILVTAFVVRFLLSFFTCSFRVLLSCSRSRSNGTLHHLPLTERFHINLYA